MKRSSIWICIILFLVPIGCAGGPTTPNKIPMGQHDLTFIKSRKPVSLIKKQEIKEIEIILIGGSTKLDLNSCCDQGIDLLQQWLAYNNIPISKDSDKKLYVSVLNPNLDDRGSFTCDLKIETGDGLVKTFSTEATAAGTGRAVGYAINWGVVKIIHNADILYYMEQ